MARSFRSRMLDFARDVGADVKFLGLFSCLVATLSSKLVWLRRLYFMVCQSSLISFITSALPPFRSG
jgi:hypothetical protein